MPDDPTVFPPLADCTCVLTGPTAAGKSSAAMEWARQIDGEILSLDSIAVYQGMDIGTAKASQLEQARIKHHLIDLIPPSEEFSVACYLKAAHQVVSEVLSRGRVPIFVGGTPMFLKGILRGFDAGPPADWEFRKAVEEDLRQHGIEKLRERLQQVDPLAAHRINPSDSRRMIRALEVARATGQPISHRQMQFEHSLPADQCNVFKLAWPREQLHQRIETRVCDMFAAGLVDEVKGLLAKHQSLSRTARQAVGYREVIDHLEGKLSIEEAQQQIVWHTRRLARRQETWFRSFPEIRSINVDEATDVDSMVHQLNDWRRQALSATPAVRRS